MPVRQRQASPAAAPDTLSRDELIEEMRSIANITDQRTLTGDEATRYEELESQLASANRSLNIGQRQTAYDTPVAGDLPALVQPGAPAGGPSAFTDRGFYNGPHSLSPDPAGLVELYNAWREKRPARVVTELFNAALTTTQTGRPTTYLGGGGPPQPLRIAEIAGIPVDRQGEWGATTAFPVFGAGAAGIAAEGAAKTEYAAVTAGSVTPSTINAFTDVSDQAYSLASFVTKLSNKLARLIAIRENQLLRDTAAGVAATQAFTAGEQSVQILRAAATIEANVGVRPDVLCFNPSNTALVFGTAVNNTPGISELDELSMRIFGMRALPMTAQTADFVLVGAFGGCSRLVEALPLTYIVDPYTLMKNNQTTLLAEESVGLAIEEALGFTSVDIVTP